MAKKDEKVEIEETESIDFNNPDEVKKFHEEKAKRAEEKKPN